MANPYQTPESFNYDKPAPDEEGDWALASVWSRIIAFLIDAMIFTVVFLGTGIGAYFWAEHTGLPLGDYALTAIATVAGLLVHLVINWVGWKSSGQSLGKRAMGIYIVRKDWEPCSMRRILFRTIPMILVVLLIPIAGVLLGLLDGVLIFRFEPYCLHDDLADTAVIRR